MSLGAHSVEKLLNSEMVCKLPGKRIGYGDPVLIAESPGFKSQNPTTAPRSFQPEPSVLHMQSRNSEKGGSSSRTLGLCQHLQYKESKGDWICFLKWHVSGRLNVFMFTNTISHPSSFLSDLNLKQAFVRCCTNWSVLFTVCLLACFFGEKKTLSVLRATLLQCTFPCQKTHFLDCSKQLRKDAVNQFSTHCATSASTPVNLLSVKLKSLCWRGSTIMRWGALKRKKEEKREKKKKANVFQYKFKMPQRMSLFLW